MDADTEGVTMLALRLPPEIEERLDALARRTGRSKSFYAREAILEHLEDLEDLYLAEEALAEHYASGGKTASMEQVLEKYGG
jgi:RHH-type rel operon transcriptional repressor/antitoxin RelB